MKNNVFVVVLYGKELDNSKTVNNLLNVGLLEDSLYIIWNNGPCHIKHTNCSFLDKDISKIKIIETVNNISLAKIYNTVINLYDAHRYVILDDDSNVSKEYITSLSDIGINQVGMPMIMVGGEVVNPCINGSASRITTKINDADVVTTIGSGLVVGKSITLELSKSFGNVFDERFFLYGVDSSFCFRLNSLKMNGNIKLIEGFDHSLSRLENNKDALLVFRRRERSNDIALQIRYYHKKSKWFRMLFMLLMSNIKKRILKNPQQYYFNLIIKTFLKGKHERQ